MVTVIFEVKFFDGRVFRVNCRGKNQVQRFRIHTNKLKTEIESIVELTNGIHNITEFENIVTNQLE
jgi:hypothetical protein